MGGQACVFYGAAQFSKDLDFALLADEQNYSRLRAALLELKANRIAVPEFDPAILARGHAVHFRCQLPEVAGIRVDVMTRLRDLADFSTLWERRTTIEDEDGTLYDLLAVEDLVQAKKTQRARDWPVIEALVEGHYRALHSEPTPERIAFWLRESRSPERLVQLVLKYPEQARSLADQRPLLREAATTTRDTLAEALDAEARAEMAKDRAYWEPLKRLLKYWSGSRCCCSWCWPRRERSVDILVISTERATSASAENNATRGARGRRGGLRRRLLVAAPLQGCASLAPCHPPLLSLRATRSSFSTVS